MVKPFPYGEAFPFCGTRVDIRDLEYETTVPPWVGPEDICKKCKKHIDARTEHMASEKNECNCEQSLLLKEQLDYACKQYSNLLGEYEGLLTTLKIISTGHDKAWREKKEVNDG